MTRAYRIVAGLPALVFVFVGLAWWIAPASAGTMFGLDLLAGRGLSTQIADLAAFFLTLGFAILIGISTGNRLWLYPPILLLGLAIVGRLIAWLFHGAAFAADMIAVEAVVIAILVLNVRELARRQA